MVQDPRQQNRREEPTFWQCSPMTPALSVEAWDPAITSTWVRLLPLLGSAHPLLPWATSTRVLLGFLVTWGAP